MSTIRSRSGSAASEERRFERIYAATFDSVAAYLLARTDRDSAADALARTFEIAWRRVADVPAEPLPWLLGVARRVLAEQWRASGRRAALFDRIAETVSETTGDHAPTLAERECVVSAVRELPASQREALLLVAWDGLTQREAAAVLGCSRAAVAVRLHRARRALQTVLRGESPDAPRSHAVDIPTREAV